MASKIKTAWTTADIPDLSGKTALVTGATGGLGYETALALANANCTVLLGGRNETKGHEAVKKIKTQNSAAKVIFEIIDHASLKSVADFAVKFNSGDQPLDILVNNAGIVGPPKRGVTFDNFELQFGTNHLSHFALTAQLFPALRRSKAPRIVNVSSLTAWRVKPDFKGIETQWAQNYNGLKVYKQTKLANLLFTFELQRRSDENGWGVSSIAAHPGYSRTNFESNGFGDDWMTQHIMKPLLSQSQKKGALPQLFAATSPQAENGGYYCPDGWMEMKGDVKEAWVTAAAKDLGAARQLWEISVKMTGIDF